MGKALQTYSIPRRKVVIMTKCYRVGCDEQNHDAGSGVAMHGDLADQSKDYANQWGECFTEQKHRIYQLVMLTST
jgi:aryl-alcohol dehydrogenase-like predicted oxidoreductase